MGVASAFEALELTWLGNLHFHTCNNRIRRKISEDVALSETGTGNAQN